MEVPIHSQYPSQESIDKNNEWRVAATNHTFKDTFGLILVEYHHLIAYVGL